MSWDLMTWAFKQDVPTFQARLSEAVQRGQARPADRSINDVGGGVKGVVFVNRAADALVAQQGRNG